ncbi:2-methylisocitrate lyase-like PEP mutase family enzyme [Methylohalomonas lacus]|uniref:2-methylisocitrate lyase-like PEP mutase family enzyme n=1 Tax=Methylohalomonas lacus TaxID=398773 RepID=A0AAE3HNC5_9GAMM|nr:oxaloacetate decarboxylase [Methylohalomonas lacus]MCS3903782.1 2-methylisocitrate lyase-like PEP mutase family enzyme [Methylohalomonas lacus]
MSDKQTAAGRLREQMQQPGIIRMLGAHDVLGALMIEQAGFESVFVGGFGTSASMLGLPDINFLGLTEMVDATRRMCERLTIPVLADADTGHGDIHNVMRCVQQFEGAGAAGIILEDQAFPKRCGHFGNKQTIEKDDMVLKFRAAVEARRDPDFVFVARTDARETHGLDAAIDRVNAYCEAGADFAFIEAPLSVEELQTICERVPYPKFVNMLVFGKTPILSAAELEAMGFKLVVAPIDSVLLAAKGMRDLAEAFKRDGHTQAMTHEMVDFEAIKEILGLPEYASLRERFQQKD